jgi:hypothetical protein
MAVLLAKQETSGGLFFTPSENYAIFKAPQMEQHLTSFNWSLLLLLSASWCLINSSQFLISSGLESLVKNKWGFFSSHLHRCLAAHGFADLYAAGGRRLIRIGHVFRRRTRIGRFCRRRNRAGRFCRRVVIGRHNFASWKIFLRF